MSYFLAVPLVSFSTISLKLEEEILKVKIQAEKDIKIAAKAEEEKTQQLSTAEEIRKAIEKSRQEQKTKQDKIHADKEIKLAAIAEKKERIVQESRQLELKRDAEKERTEQERIKRDSAIACAKEKTKQAQEERKKAEAEAKIAEAKVIVAKGKIGAQKSNIKRGAQWKINELTLGEISEGEPPSLYGHSY